MHPTELPLDHECKIIDHHPAGILAIEKACGVLSHPNQSKAKSRTLLKCNFDFDHECYQWEDQGGRLKRVYLVHRLDSATSGVILACINEEISSVLKNAFADKKVDKEYHAIVRYNGQKISPFWKDFLQKKNLNGKLRVTIGKTGGPALTSAKIIRIANSRLGMIALLNLRPKTGKSHQLRVQCASRQLPIIGDKTYGNFEINRKIEKSTKSKRLMLHASSIKFNLKRPNNTPLAWEAESSLPRCFGKFLS